VQRDVREVVEIEKLDHVPRLLQVLAHHSAQLTNFTQIGGQVGLDDKTTRAYLGHPRTVVPDQACRTWFNNRLSRLLKTPKLHFLDSGLLAALLGATTERITTNRSVLAARPAPVLRRLPRKDSDVEQCRAIQGMATIKRHADSSLASA
jgi:predicted AAA+ superfamily ATPase